MVTYLCSRCIDFFFHVHSSRDQTPGLYECQNTLFWHTDIFCKTTIKEFVSNCFLCVCITSYPTSDTTLKRDHLVGPVTEILMISQEMVITLQFIFVGTTWVVFSATGR